MTTNTILLGYGHQEIPLTVAAANLLDVYYPSTHPGATHQEYLLEQALAHPIGTPRLREMVQPGEKIAIVTSDLTRPTPSARLLPYIARELEAGGIPDQDVSIVVALGLHRPMTTPEIKASLSPAILQRYRVMNHDPEDVVHLGVTSYGTPVEIFRPLVQADMRICLGNIEFHYFAGYSGGAKAILPGCASRRCITANHSHMVETTAVAGRVSDNPVRLDLEEGVAMLGVDFLLNVVVDGQHQVVGAFAGHVQAAHRLGCAMVDQRGSVAIPSLGDIVIASAGGYPKDINFYQAHKALENAKYFVRPGGIIILLAECTEGIGNKTMQGWITENDHPQQALEKIQNEFVIGVHKVAAIAMIEQRSQIYIVSQLPKEIVRQLSFTPFPDLHLALQAALEKLGQQSKVIVLPQANSILPLQQAHSA